MQINLDPLRDAQLTQPMGYCINCGCELYNYDPIPLCLECLEEMEAIER